MTQEGVLHEYTTRLARHRAERDALSRLDSRLADIRLYVVIAAGIAAYLAFGAHWFSPWALAVFVLGFAALMVRHEKVAARLARVKRRVAFYEQGMARLEDRWQGQGTSGGHFLDPQHSYAGDLDLFGKGSLFELLCTARTRIGEERLASWLLTPSDLGTLRARQDAVRELTPGLDRRESLALLGEDVQGKIQPDALAAWGEAPARLSSRRQRGAALGLAVASILALAVWGLGLGGRWSVIPFAVIVVLARLFEWPLRGPVGQVRRDLDGPLRDLGLLSTLLAYMERETLHSPKLQEMQRSLGAGSDPASARIARLQSLAGSLEAAKNQLFAPLAALLLWNTQYAFALEAWRAAHSCAAGWTRWASGRR